MTEKEWIFGNYCSPNCKIGVLLRHELNNIDESIEIEERRRLALENLGETIGCEIKPFDFLALGGKTFLNVRGDVCEGINRKIEEIKIRAKK